MCVCKLCVCVSKLCVGKLCVSKLCVSKLCVGKLCVGKWCVCVCCGKYFVQALQYEVALGRALCKLCSTKLYWEVLCASFVVRSSTGKYFVQAL